MSIKTLDAFRRSPLEVLRDLRGYYKCPKDADGKRQGPLVAYADRDAQGRQFVGDEYANFAAAESYPHLLVGWAERMHDKVQSLGKVDLFLGMPMGSIYWSMALGFVYVARVGFVEKEVLKAKTSTSRERSRLIFGRHSPNPRDRVVICEDVTNNFSTTREAVKLVSQCGAEVVGIAALLNRSFPHKAEFEYIPEDLPVSIEVFPVEALVKLEIQQFQQDDPFVADDVKANNVVWKVKPEWPRLEAVMKAHEGAKT